MKEQIIDMELSKDGTYVPTGKISSSPSSKKKVKPLERVPSDPTEKLQKVAAQIREKRGHSPADPTENFMQGLESGLAFINTLAKNLKI